VYFEADEEAGFVLPCTGKAQNRPENTYVQAESMRAFRLKMGLPVPYF
jgi:hypothetical protein